MNPKTATVAEHIGKRIKMRRAEIGLSQEGLADLAGIDRTYDSPLWIPEKVSPAVIDTGHLVKTIDGAAGTSSFTTWHLGDDQHFTLLRRARVRWLDDPTTASMCYFACNEHGSAFSACGGSIAQSSNKFDALHSARWHKLKFTTTGDCEFSGVAVDLQPQGGW